MPVSGFNEAMTAKDGEIEVIVARILEVEASVVRKSTSPSSICPLCLQCACLNLQLVADQA